MDLPETAPSVPRSAHEPDLSPMCDVIAACCAQRARFRDKWRERHTGAGAAGPQRTGVDGQQSKAGSATRLAYLENGKKLLLRFERETGLHVPLDDFDPVSLVDWLIGAVLRGGDQGETSATIRMRLRRWGRTEGRA